jgi:hypothetical protein
LHHRNPTESLSQPIEFDTNGRIVALSLRFQSIAGKERDHDPDWHAPGAAGPSLRRKLEQPGTSPDCHLAFVTSTINRDGMAWIVSIVPDPE